MHSFEDLKVWKVSREFRKRISEFAKILPDSENYNLKSQLVRSSRSITANIAEGFGRFHFQENIQFCRISRGSLFETLDHLTCCLDEGYINEEKFKNYKNEFDQVLKLLNSYIKYLNNAKQEKTNPNN
ncbi:MAG: four helix bundle protein [Flavobacteriales bacterium]